MTIGERCDPSGWKFGCSWLFHPEFILSVYIASSSGILISSVSFNCISGVCVSSRVIVAMTFVSSWKNCFSSAICSSFCSSSLNSISGSEVSGLNVERSSFSSNDVCVAERYTSMPRNMTSTASPIILKVNFFLTSICSLVYMILRWYADYVWV